MIITRCSNCDRVLTTAHGVRLESANFSSALPTRPATTTITYAWCDGCLVDASGQDRESYTDTQDRANYHEEHDNEHIDDDHTCTDIR